MSVAEKMSKRICFDLENDPKVGRCKLVLVIKQSGRNELANAARHYFNRRKRRMHAPSAMEGETMEAIGLTDFAEVIINNIESGNPEREKRAKVVWSLMRKTHPEIDQEIKEYKLAREALMGWGLSSITGKLKKAAKAVKKAAKKAKKHNFKKDISKINKVGKVVGPIAAAAPPPYGPAIAGGLMILDAADKYNKGAVDQIDAAKIASSLGVEESDNVKAILSTAQNIKNNVKATELIKLVSNGNKAAIAKMTGIKKMAAQGNLVARNALAALEQAKIGVKLGPVQKVNLVAKSAPMTTRQMSVSPASRQMQLYSAKKKDDRGIFRKLFDWLFGRK